MPLLTSHSYEIMAKSLLGTAVVGGGTGFIGSHLCSALKSQGYAVTVISRMPGPQRLTWNELNSKGLPEGTTTVINLAGQNVLNMKQRWSAGFKQNVFTSRVNTTTSLANAIIKTQNKPSTFITMSGVGIYKPDKVKIYDEDCEPEEFDFLSRLCHQWEEAARLSEGHTRRVTIRSGVVLGRNGGMIKQLYLPFYFGLGGPVMPGDQYLPWIHIDDLVNLILYSISNSNVEGTLNGVAPHTITNKEFSDAFAKALNRPSLIPVPEFVLNILLSKERANMLTQGQMVVPKKATDLGFEFKYPDIMSACREVVKNG